MNQILIIGSANIDITHTGNKFPEYGETLFSKNSYISVGGKGLNQAISASRLSYENKVLFLGTIGSDILGEKIINDLIPENLDISNLRTAKDETTGNAIIYIGKGNNNQISVHPGANSLCGDEEVYNFMKIVDKISIVVLQHEIPIETNYRILTIAKNHNITTVLDPGPSINIPKKFTDYYHMVDYLTPNINEAEFILGKKISGYEVEAAKEIKDLGPKNVIVTLGKKGIATSGEINKKFPAFEVNSIDPVGSGDCFNGALAVKINEKYSLREACLFAQKAAAESTKKQGASVSFPFYKDLY